MFTPLRLKAFVPTTNPQLESSPQVNLSNFKTAFVDSAFYGKLPIQALPGHLQEAAELEATALPGREAADSITVLLDHQKASSSQARRIGCICYSSLRSRNS